MRNAHKGGFAEIEKVRAQDRVEGRQILDRVAANGWRLAARHCYTHEGFGIAGSRGLTISPEAREAAAGDDPSGIYLFHQP